MAGRLARSWDQVEVAKSVITWKTSTQDAGCVYHRDLALVLR